MKDHTKCERIKTLLSEVGVDSKRVMCFDTGSCIIGLGMGEEGLAIDFVEKMVDKAIELAEKKHQCPPRFVGDDWYGA